MVKQLWETNKLGVLALCFTAIGILATIIPLLGFIAFLTLPTGLILGIVSLAKKAQPKWLGVTSVVASSITILVNIVIATLLIIAVFSFLLGLIQNLTV